MVTLLFALACGTTLEQPRTGPTSATDSLLDDSDSPTVPDPPTPHDPLINPADLDLDGWYTPADCDDTDPTIHPGVPDPCDGIDQDCDGEAQADGSCGGFADWEGSGSWIGPDVYGLGIVPGGEMDGRAVSTGSAVVFMGAAAPTTWGASFLLHGIPAEHDTLWEAAEILGIWSSREYEDCLRGVRPGGDVNGDGWDDVWLWGDGGLRDCDAELYLMLGPSSGWPVAGAYPRDVYDGWWRSAIAETNFGRDVDVGADLDADGLGDALIVACCDTDTSASIDGAVHLVLGRADDLPGGETIDREITLWLGDHPLQEQISELTFGVDADGDGLLDPVGGYSGTSTNGSDLGFVRGAEFLQADGGTYADWVDVAAYVADMYVLVLEPPGDLDGDGYDDLALSSSAHPDHFTIEECVTYVSAADALASGSWEGAVLATACLSNNELSTVHSVADIDHDGVLDASVATRADVNGRAGQSVTCMLPSSRFALGGKVDSFDIGWCTIEGPTRAADLDGDGQLEFVGEWDDRVEVMPGFVIPWDDPNKW